jgi:hypothetical protein
MLHRAALVRTYVSEEHIASIITVTRIGELGTTFCKEILCEKGSIRLWNKLEGGGRG